MNTITYKIYDQLKRLGLKGQVVSIQHLQDMQNKIEAEYALGLLAEDFYRERLQFYRFSPPENFSTASSIIVVAVPRPQTPINFSWNGKSITLTLPPTYARYDEITRQVGDILTSILAPEGYRIAPALLPLKLLSTSSGLAEYGRNNISYIPGMGSFFQLSAFYTDSPNDQDNWKEPSMMERCKTCQACLKKCPTGAIVSDRFLLHAERCLVFHNERSAAHQFPPWIEPGMHHCLMGCMVCQQYCPEDKPFLAWFDESVDFSSEETDLLLKGSDRRELPADTIRKLKLLELIDSLELLPRNLGVFFKTTGLTAQ